MGFRESRRIVERRRRLGGTSYKANYSKKDEVLNPKIADMVERERKRMEREY